MKELDQLKMLSEQIARLEEEPIDTGAGKATGETVGDTGSDMEWSIHIEPVDYELEPDEWEWDISTNAPDGVYVVVYDYLGHLGKANGVTVKNGKFVIPQTMQAVEKAVNKTGYSGRFIEALRFDPKRNIFLVSIGS